MGQYKSQPVLQMFFNEVLMVSMVPYSALAAPGGRSAGWFISAFCNTDRALREPCCGYAGSVQRRGPTVQDDLQDGHGFAAAGESYRSAGYAQSLWAGCAGQSGDKFQGSGPSPCGAAIAVVPCTGSGRCLPPKRSR